jgi:hypothetical protein
VDFRAELELNGKTATGIEVPASVLEALGGGRRAAVRVTLREHTYRTTVGAMGGRAMVPVSAEVRAAAGVAAGDGLDVRIELDTEPRTVELPADLAAAFAAASAAGPAFAALSPSQQKELVRSVESAKKPETRQRRIQTALDNLT